MDCSITVPVRQLWFMFFNSILFLAGDGPDPLPKET
jgi:hypothetical protein